MKRVNYFVYILTCYGNFYYTGYTTDLNRRYQEHVQGTDKCKFTRSFKPLHIAQSWKIRGTRASAMKIERFIKKLSKKEKEHFIYFPDQLSEKFPDLSISSN